MDEEKIVRLWRFAYIKLFDADINMDYRWITFIDKQAKWQARKIFWRFYWLNLDF